MHSQGPVVFLRMALVLLVFRRAAPTPGERGWVMCHARAGLFLHAGAVNTCLLHSRRTDDTIGAFVRSVCTEVRVGVVAGVLLRVLVC